MAPMAQVLRQLPAMNHPALLAGAEHFEDAGVYRLRDDLAVVLTTDFFPPLVDDAYVFGQIAAANALSDVYAMGAEPVCALNVVGFPDDQLGLEVLVEILRGGADKVLEAGAVIAGGHSVRDAEIKYGLAVMGTVHPDRIIRNGGARRGDMLVLTKPLGSGVLTTAAKAGKIKAAELDEAVAVMSALNRAGCAAMIAAGAHAATDVTGFGLVGHAYEMADAGNVTLVIEAGRVPLMGRVLDLASAGCLTRACRSTLERVGTQLAAAEDVDEMLIGVLADAQTSGGLLVALAPDRVESFMQAFAAAAPPEGAKPAVIGRVEAAGEARVRLA